MHNWSYIHILYSIFLFLGELCGNCRDGKGVSALLNRCVSCSDASGLLILALSKTNKWANLEANNHLSLSLSCGWCWNFHCSTSGNETLPNVGLPMCILLAGAHKQIMILPSIPWLCCMYLFFQILPYLTLHFPRTFDIIQPPVSCSIKMILIISHPKPLPLSSTTSAVLSVSTSSMTSVCIVAWVHRSHISCGTYLCLW